MGKGKVCIKISESIHLPTFSFSLSPIVTPADLDRSTGVKGLDVGSEDISIFQPARNLLYILPFDTFLKFLSFVVSLNFILINKESLAIRALATWAGKLRLYI